MADRIFDPWNVGDPITAARLNQIQKVLQDLDHPSGGVGKSDILIRWVKLTQWIGPDSGTHDNRSGTIQFLDPSDNQWHDTNPAQTLSTITDPTQKRIYAQDSIIPVHMHWSGLAVPLAGHKTLLLVKTTAPVSQGTSTTAYKIYSGTPGSEVDAGFTSVPSALCRLRTLASGSWAYIEQTVGGWEIRQYHPRIYRALATVDIASGASGAISLSDGNTVTATNWSPSDIATGDKLIAYEDFTTGIFYCMSTAATPSDVTTVHAGTAVDTTAPGATGTVTIASGSVEAVNQSPITYFAGDPLTVYEEASVWYAIPAGTQVFATTCPSPGVIAGGTIDITLPDGQIVSATNYARTKCFTDSKIHVYLDRSTGGWYILRTDDFLRRRVKGLINMAAGLKGTDANATVDNIATLDGSSAPTITTATNTLKLWGDDNDVVILEEETWTGGAASWFVAEIQPKARHGRTFKALLNGNLSVASATATIDTVTAIDGGTAPAPTVASNFFRLSGNDNDEAIIVEDWSTGTVAYILLSVKKHNDQGLLVIAVVDADLNLNDATASIDSTSITTLDGSTAPSFTSASNILNLSALSGDTVLLADATGGDLAAWEVVAVISRFRRRVKALLNGALSCADSSATVDTVAVFDQGPAQTITTATNPLKLSGPDNAVVILEEIATASPSTWFVAAVEEQSAILFKGQLNGNLTAGTSTISVDTLSSYTASAAPSGSVTANNVFKLDGRDNDVCVVIRNRSSGTITYDLLRVEQRNARFITGTLAGSLTSGNVSHYWDGPNPGSSVTLADPQGAFTYVSNVKFMACYDPAGDVYNLIWIEC